MKIVINKCFGGFGLSREAVKRLAEITGCQCFFFEHDLTLNKYVSDSGSRLSWFAFDIENPNEIIRNDDIKESNELFRKHALDQRFEDRSNPNLIRVVEELGIKANGAFAQLSVIEIPDGIKWHIEEYDGMERVDEDHQTWG